ncbi:hypothetical protein BDQ17DRAFT_1358900, partial [Cyathus striatus]
LFGKIAGLIAIATFTWIGVLTRYNHRPLLTHILTRTYARTLWCAAAAFSATLAFLTSLFCDLATATGAGLSVNIAEGDSRRNYGGI